MIDRPFAIQRLQTIAVAGTNISDKKRQMYIISMTVIACGKTFSSKHGVVSLNFQKIAKT
jgi:hypothetical protein